MTTTEQIDFIKRAQSIRDVFPDISNWKKQYKDYMVLLHPDICFEDGAGDAVAILNVFKTYLENGLKHRDDVGEVVYSLNNITITGEKSLLQKSFDNYRKLSSLTDKSSESFRKYLPTSGGMFDDKLVWTVPTRAIPLSSLGELEIKHVNWVLSRMLEFSAWLAQVGYSHLGLNPDSVYVVPENHGIIITSFYHLKRIGENVDTISSRYKSVYPSQLFVDKKATVNIDVECSKRIAIYLLGDRSSVGTKLRKTVDSEMLDYYLKQETSPYEAFVNYRELLRGKFDTKQFHILNK